MNRNANSRFSQLPKVEIPRSIFDRSCSHKTTFDIGSVVPVYVDEIVPGDSFKITTSKVIRLQTLLTPMMDNLFCDFYWFFCPNRLLWEHWQEFCGENTQSAWAPTTTYTIPKIASPVGGFQTGTLADYMGIPVNVEFDGSDPRDPYSLPFRAYALICDTFFRNENVTDPLNIPKGDATQQGSNGSNYIDDVANGGMPFIAAKTHDYFTSALPSPLKGNPVGFPIDFTPFSGLAPVNAYPDYQPLADASKGSVLQGYFVNKDGNITYPYENSLNDYESRVKIRYGYSDYFGPGLAASLTNKTTGDPDYPTNESGAAAGGFVPANLYANIPSVDSLSASITINDLRLAFSLQRFLEQLARSGSRYIELLQGVFGVTSPDARLQLPEYLGGNRVPVVVHQVTNTAQAERDFLGDVGGMSVTRDKHFDVEKSFVEHGIIMCLAVMRYNHTYSQGLESFWSRNSFTDFYIPTFANIGEQPIFKSEIYFDPATNNDVFGYQEAWSSYRYKPNRVSGEFRPGIQNSLASWHLADYYEHAPTLSDAWMREDKTNVDRTLAVTSSVSNQAFMDIRFNVIATRPMPMYSIPMLEGHF